jgi:hypothetical protein
MSLANYQRLQQSSRASTAQLGCTLPVMNGGTLTCQSSVQNAAATREMIASFKAKQGWFMMRDQLIIDATPPTGDDFIEGEWCNGQNSLKVKLLYADQYQLTKMTQTTATTPSQAYTEQTVYLRNDLINAQHNVALYRLWWDLQQGDNQGRWLPLAQQFAGFKMDSKDSK